MSSPAPNPWDYLNDRLNMLSERVDELEREVIRNKKHPKSRPWAMITGLFLFLSIGLVAIPKEITIDGNRYQSQGLPAESITALLGVLTALGYVHQRQKEH